MSLLFCCFFNTLFWCSVYVATFVDRHCALFLLLGWLIGWFGQISGCARCRIRACFYLNFKSDELCAALTSLSQTNWIFTPQISLPPPAFDRLCLSTHVFVAAHYSPPPKSPHSCRRGWSYLPGEGVWLVRSVRRMWTPWRNWSTRTSSPPIRSRSWSNTAPTTTNRLVSADINPRICLLEVNPRNCSLVIPRYLYRQSYCSPFFWLIVRLSVLGFANLDEWIICIPFYACLSYNQSFRKPIQRKNNPFMPAFDIMYNSLAWDFFLLIPDCRFGRMGELPTAEGSFQKENLQVAHGCKDCVPA